jgi:hypothetical protein
MLGVRIDWSVFHRVLRRHRLDHGDGQSQGRALDHEGRRPRHTRRNLLEQF